MRTPSKLGPAIALAALTSLTGAAMGWLAALEPGRPTADVARFAVWGAFANLPILFVLLFYLHVRVFDPLRRLVATASRAEEGDYFIRAEVSSRDEVGRLASIMNELLAKITDLRVQRIDGDRTLEEVERELSLKAALAEKSKELEQAYHALDERLRDLTFVYDLGRELASELDMNKLFDRLARLIPESLSVPSFGVLAFEEKQGALQIVAQRGFTDELLGTPDLEGSALAEAIAKLESVYVPSLTADGRRIIGLKLEAGSLFLEPVTHRGQLIALFVFSSPKKEAFGAEHRRLFTAVGHQASLALANARLFSATMELSLTDGLTGVLNRRALEERLNLEWEDALRYHHPLSVAMIDIDHFKHYNDTFGHQLGDDVLRRVSRTLAQNLRRVDGLGRYGGEEFVAVLPHTSEAEAERTAEKLRAAVELIPLPQGKITVSIGVATYPRDARNLLALVSVADEGLLRAKRAGRNRVERGDALTSPESDLPR